jgi:hypothetical protein
MTERAYTWVRQNLKWQDHIVPKFHNHIQRLYAELQNETAMIEAPNQEDKQPTTNWRIGETI